MEKLTQHIKRYNQKPKKFKNYELCKVTAKPLGNWYGPSLFDYSMMPTKVMNALKEYIKQYPEGTVDVYIGTDMTFKNKDYTITSSTNKKLIDALESDTSDFIQSSELVFNFLFQSVANTVLDLNGLEMSEDDDTYFSFDVIVELDQKTVVPYLELLRLI